MNGADLGRTAATYWTLFTFGVLYSLAVGWLSSHGYTEGYTWLAVVAGVLITVAALAIFGIFTWIEVGLILGAFAASGTPMVAGDIWRHLEKRKQAQDAVRREL